MNIASFLSEYITRVTATARPYSEDIYI